MSSVVAAAADVAGVQLVVLEVYVYRGRVTSFGHVTYKHLHGGRFFREIEGERSNKAGMQRNDPNTKPISQ